MTAPRSHVGSRQVVTGVLLVGELEFAALCETINRYALTHCPKHAVRHAVADVLGPHVRDACIDASSGSGSISLVVADCVRRAGGARLVLVEDMPSA